MQQLEAAEKAKLELQNKLAQAMAAEKALREDMRWAYRKLREIMKALNLTSGCYTYELDSLTQVIDKLQICEIANEHLGHALTRHLGSPSPALSEHAHMSTLRWSPANKN